MQSRDVAVAIGVVVLVVLILALLVGGMMAWGVMGPGMMGYGGFGFSPWWGILMIVFWLLIIGGLVFLIFWFFQQIRPVQVSSTTGAGRALEILRERYARGEITREQYEQMRSDIEGHKGS